ncbi:MAG: GGDEF domain-containing protein [Rhizobacter sp.]|nr:GGDEF domain-containing protein [Rhizobacter sp.]
MPFLHSSTLLVAFATVVALASVVSLAVHRQQQSRRGARWWLAANAALAAAMVLQAMSAPSEVGTPVASMLALPWPIVTLAGIRRFYARGGTRVSEWSDRVALVIAVFAAVASWIEPIELASAPKVHAVAAFALTLYTASAIARLEDFATSSTLRTLRLTLVTAALAQGAWLALIGAVLGPAVPVGDGSLVALLATAAMAVTMTQLAPVMTLERRIAHLLASQRKLRNLVDVDALTRLPNRRHFHELAERAIEQARDAATLIVFDVDRLNRINEMLGHATGDEALRQIGTALRETLRRRDVAGRLGGDEFAVVLPRTRLADSAIVVSRIVARLDDRQVAPRIARVALNVGAVQFKSNETVGDALRRADAELVAKRDAARRADADGAPPPPGVVATPAAPPAVASTAVATTITAAKTDEAPTPSALMSLIPVGEVKVAPVR